MKVTVEDSTQVKPKSQSMSRESTVSVKKVADENALMIGRVIRKPTASEIFIPAKKVKLSPAETQNESSRKQWFVRFYCRW